MSKELDALERLMNKCCDRCFNDAICVKETNNSCSAFRNYKIVYNALKRLDDLQQMLYKMNVKHGYKEYLRLKELTQLDAFDSLIQIEAILPRGKELLIPVAKQLKALDALKEIDKTSLLHFLAVCVKDQDKYELLKEVLL